jgi:putative endonuclease
MQTEKQEIGELGENIACKFLMKHGYKILDRNYRKKWGEIDIIAQKNNILHFIEVKTVSRETEHMPEENVHPWKRKRLARAIQTYLLEKNTSGLPANEEGETEWQVDILAVFLDFNSKKAKIRITKNVIL